MVEGLVRTFEKLHDDRALTFDVDLQPGLRFRGEAQDLTDLIGNLLDNAGKWARERVAIRAARAAGGGSGPRSLSHRRDRRRRPGPRQKRARRGDRARQAARRVAARLRPRPVDRRRSRFDLRRLARARRKPARGLARDSEAAMRVSARRSPISATGRSANDLAGDSKRCGGRFLSSLRWGRSALPAVRASARAARRRRSPLRRATGRPGDSDRRGAWRRPRRAGRSVAQRRRPPDGMGGAGRRARFGSAALLARLAWRVRLCRARRRDGRRLPRLFPDHLYRRPAEPRPRASAASSRTEAGK